MFAVDGGVGAGGGLVNALVSSLGSAMLQPPSAISGSTGQEAVPSAGGPSSPTMESIAREMFAAPGTASSSVDEGASSLRSFQPLSPSPSARSENLQ